MSKKKDKKKDSKKKETPPSEKEVIAYVKTRLDKIFGSKVPLGEATLTVTFKDGTAKSYNVTP
jgi:hypothetical protein